MSDPSEPLHLVHHHPGRVRVRARAFEGGTEAFDRVRSALAALPGIEAVAHGVGAGSVLERCTVRGPVVIGERCRLSDTYVGPYTAISDGVVVEQAEIEHSIILENSRICRLGARMADSLIGRDCVIAHSDALPVAYRFMVGDSSQIGIL